MSEEFKPGDIVRVKDPESFISLFAKKVTDRDAVVEGVGPDTHGQFKNEMWVRFLKRNGRGKEFQERLYFRDCIKIEIEKEPTT